MTSKEPPEGDETEGIEQNPIAGSMPAKLPAEKAPREAHLFVPEGSEPGDPLHIRVWTLNETTMNIQAMRRC